MASGRIQRVALDTSQGELDPDYITVAAGTPVEVRFRASEGCSGRPKIEGAEYLGISHDALLLAPMRPGVYSIYCGDDGPDGLIVVR